MNKLQIIITIEWFLGLAFGLIIFLLFDIISNNAVMLILILLITAILNFIFSSMKKSYGFNNEIEVDILQRLFNEYVAIRFFIMTYFLIQTIFIVFVLLNGGFKSESESWLLLIAPYFIPFFVAIYYEQMKSADSS